MGTPSTAAMLPTLITALELLDLGVQAHTSMQLATSGRFVGFTRRGLVWGSQHTHQKNAKKVV